MNENDFCQTYLAAGLIYLVSSDMHPTDESCRAGESIVVCDVFPDGSFHYMGLSGKVHCGDPEDYVKLIPTV